MGGGGGELGFRPSRTLLDLIRACRPAAPRRPESPLRHSRRHRRPRTVGGKVARFVGGKRRVRFPWQSPAVSDDDCPRSERVR
ncbi:Os11g0127951 [Oryza sativa Japonica Group]|uniref:Os11g0127951 protein n=1 Tax=Oryza sativa subsp. japonica TaxID=39947 RepID=A0A0P0XYN9_ORYSJ|nr:hypothetical protein EE612_053273 [Oryza sativa]KAF2909278.1 hypothetical protein DAI22_11g014900 [Oryza sativa Japonica Group]BAT12492.1 Os11g0127951 [Oryza sativa Japonica Group]